MVGIDAVSESDSEGGRGRGRGRGWSGQRVVLITGCTPGGIGHALVEEFFSRVPWLPSATSTSSGLHVIATARSTQAIEALQSLNLETTESTSVVGGGRISTLALDVTSVESIRKAVEAVKELTNGRLDILVNNAGRHYPMPALDADVEVSKAVFDTNVFGVMSMVQAFSPLLIHTSSQLPPSVPAPQIVMIGSISAVNPYTFGSVYNASKAALHAYSNTLRIELDPFGVGVLLVVTGGVQSNITLQRTTTDPSKTSDALLNLPSSSLYKPIQAYYDRRQTHSQEGATPTRTYAKQVVDATLPGGKKEIWRGNKAALVMLVVGYLGRWVLDSVMGRMFGLVRLKAIVRAARGR